jgi:hypothetical protein
MKKARFLFPVMIAGVLLHGTSLAAQASPVTKQAISQSSENSAEQPKDEVRDEKDQARPKESDDSQLQPDVTRTTTKHRPNTSHSKPVPSHRVRPAKTPTTNSPRIDAPGSLAPPEHMGSKAATYIPNKTISGRSVSVPSSAVSVNGQQFRNSRDPGAHLAASGGPSTAARGTAAISGTNMKRKP